MMDLVICMMLIMLKVLYIILLLDYIIKSPVLMMKIALRTLVN